MKRLLVVLLVLALPVIVSAQVDIAIEHAGGWTTVTHTTSSDENTAGQYYQAQETNALCSAQSLADECTEAEYDTECAKGETPACETFYPLTALGGKQWFMDKVIKFNLASMVASRESDIGTRGRDHWNTLTLAEKEAQCVAWGYEADCS